MVPEGREEWPWNANIDGLRTGRSQRFIGPHEKDTRSPRLKSRKSDAASEKGSPVSPRERSNTIGERGGFFAINRDRGTTFSFGTEDEYKDVPIQPFKGSNANEGKSHDNAKAKEVPNDERNIRRDYGSLRPPEEQETHHDPWPDSSESDHSIDETSDREIQAVSDLSEEPEEIETLPKTPPSSQGKERDSLVSQPQQSGSGPVLVDAAPIHDTVEEPVDLGININDEAPDSTHSPDSTEIFDSRPIHHPVEEPVDLGINTNDETPDAIHSPNNTENADTGLIHDPIEEPVDLDINMNDKAPASTQSPDTVGDVDTHPIHNPGEEQVDPGTAMNDEAPDATHLPDTMENADQDVQLMSGNGEIAFSRPKFTGSIHVRSPISQLGSPGIGHFENPRSQPSPARNDQIQSPDSAPQSPEPGRVTVETSPVQDEVADEFGVVAWLNSPSSLPKEYYKLYSEIPIPSRPELSSSPDSHAESIGTGSLIVSPVLSVRLPCST